MAGASGGPLGFLSVMSEYRRSRMCDHRWLNSRLTGLRSHFGHWLCSRHGTDSGVDLAPERAGSACSNLFVCSSLSEQTNKQLLYSVHDTRRTFGGLGRPHFCSSIAWHLALMTIYTNIQISMGWLLFWV